MQLPHLAEIVYEAERRTFKVQANNFVPCRNSRIVRFTDIPAQYSTWTRTPFPRTLKVRLVRWHSDDSGVSEKKLMGRRLLVADEADAFGPLDFGRVREDDFVALVESAQDLGSSRRYAAELHVRPDCFGAIVDDLK